MSNDTQELIRTYEQLPAAKRVEVVDFARFLLGRTEGRTSTETVDGWMTRARGAAKPGATTEGVMNLTRGEP